MARHFRPRFSVRTLVIFVTLICAYLGTWEATRRHGPRDVLLAIYPEYSPQWVDDSYIPAATANGSISVPMPFVVVMQRRIQIPSKPDTQVRDHYFWFNGWTTSVPPKKAPDQKHKHITEYI